MHTLIRSPIQELSANRLIEMNGFCLYSRRFNMGTTITKSNSFCFADLFDLYKCRNYTGVDGVLTLLDFGTNNG